MSKKGIEMLRCSIEATFTKFVAENPTVDSTQVKEMSQKFVKAVYTELIERMKADKLEQEKELAAHNNK